MFGFKQCCDAGGYIELGKLCSSNLDYCWNAIRPVGAIHLSAAMPYGLAPFSNFLLLILSLFLIASELDFKPSRKSLIALIFKACGLFVCFA
ncbi:hypothetical protein [Methylobacter tundripaludum]|uniref:Uncharacterized protein n=1 Tax=Methylobacter tundripaludum (strain ATCC BAA-1195 / DSM 17260 / SV96) TaxID=697282 RepID=G3IVT8_METTV|nr:hypothetical protein [Methylobacter tundripaludum]EGW22945.1 hypothetical protein Mettu_1782 [Methylobacter tundripaludum SV96]